MKAGAWDAMRDLTKDPATIARRPNVGRRVRVIAGRMLGAEGQVTWHGRDRFARTRYMDSMQSHLANVQGLWGFRVRIQPDAGEPFFIGAEKVCVL